jgi:heptosyltransferase-2
MKRILVRAPNWIGDQIMAYPFFVELRKRYPGAWIAVVCTEWVKDIQFKGLVDEVYVLPKRRGDSFYKSAKNIWKFSKTIQAKGPWDFGISLPNSFGAALLFYLVGVTARRGYNTDARGILLTEKVTWNPSHQIHRAQAYLNLITEVTNTELQVPEFDPMRSWPDIVPIDPPKAPYFVIAPGATADSRRWSVDQFAALIELFSKKYGYKAVIVGGNAEKEIATQLFRKGVQIEDYTARGWVSAHWKLFRNAKFTVCNESGLAHVAALCGSNVQIVCGAADPRRTRPIGPGKVQVKFNPVECWPCEKNICRFQGEAKNQCLKGISAESVYQEVSVGFLSP